MPMSQGYADILYCICTIQSCVKVLINRLKRDGPMCFFGSTALTILGQLT